MGYGCAGIDQEVFRICSNCGKPGIKDDFLPAIGFIAGRHAECKRCQVKRQIEAGQHYQDCLAGLREDSPQSDKARVQEQKRIVEQAKNQPCQRCGQQLSPGSMRFAYTKGERAFQLDRRPADLHTETLLNELAKCEVVCVSCLSEYKSQLAKGLKTKRAQQRHEHVSSGFEQKQNCSGTCTAGPDRVYIKVGGKEISVPVEEGETAEQIAEKLMKVLPEGFVACAEP